MRIASLARPLLVVALIVLSGCAASEDALDASPATMVALEPFSQPIAGTVLSLEMVPVPGDRFWVSTTEITWDLYDVFVFELDDPADDVGDTDAITRPSKPYIAMDRGFGHNGYPALSMSFHGAETFCRWLSAKTGRRYRLPTLEEWRRVCAQSGIDASTVNDHAWYAGNADHTTHQVGTKAPDALGLFDLAGNAAEWCRTDGTPVVAGGSFRDDAVGCTAVAKDTPDWNASDPQFPKSIWWLADAGFVGLRVVCEPDSN